MMDPTDTGSYSTDEISKKSPERSPCGETLNQLKTCADCGTTKTPLWRGGPAGPKSLCNACGIRSRKKRRALLGLNKEDKDKKPKKNNSNTSTVTTSDGGSSTSSSDGNKLGNSMTRKLVCLGKQVVLQRPRSSMFNKRRKLGEEEQAAMLLMALSCGSVFA